MGYYSDVAVAFTEEGYGQFKKQFTELLNVHRENTNKDYLEEFVNKVNNPVHVAEDKSVLLSFKNYKWYEYDPKDYPEIYSFQNAINNLDDEDFLFIRIGEETDDNEILGNYYDNPFELGIRREIAYTAPDLKETEDESLGMSM